MIPFKDEPGRRVVDSTRLNPDHLRLIENTWFDNRTDLKRKNIVVQISLMCFESKQYADDARVYASFGDYDRIKRNNVSRRFRQLMNSRAEHREYYNDVEQWFITVIKEHKFSKKQSNGQWKTTLPDYYISGLRHRGGNKFTERGAALMIMNESGTEPVLWTIALGDVRYLIEAGSCVKTSNHVRAKGQFIIHPDDCDHDVGIDFEDEMDELINEKYNE